MSSLKRTPLFEVYEKYGGKTVDFSGWELPVQFTGIKDEHLAVRRKAGLFDVSHMGEIWVRGKGAADFINRNCCNDVTRLKPGGSQYSGLLNEAAGFIDDIFIYMLGPEEYLICVNASNADKDFAWLSKKEQNDCQVVNESADWAQLAIQGPGAVEIANQASQGSTREIPRMHIAQAEITGARLLAVRTGYTGEDGFEFFLKPEDGPKVWETLFEAGKTRGLAPCGLGARDTLRLEMGYPLHGHDITEETTPLMADLAWIVKVDKPDFVGKPVLLEQKKNGVGQKRVGLVMEESGIPRDGYKIISAGGEGKVTSGTKTPCAKSAIAMGYVVEADAIEGAQVQIEIRGKAKRARISKWPFYRPESD